MSTAPVPAKLPKHVDTLGIERPLGRRKPRPGSIVHLMTAGTPVPDVPESQWQEFDYAKDDPTFPLVIKDQDGRGACNGHATATCMEARRWLNGQPYVPLSGWFPYAILCNGNDVGSSIGEALALIIASGLAPESQVKYGIIDPRLLTAESRKVALDYRCEIGCMLTTWHDLMSATQVREPFNFSIRAGDRFEPNSEGVVTVNRGAGNHAVCGGLGAKKLKSGKWAIKWNNSWTPGWGVDGSAWFTEDHWVNQRYREAFTIRTAIENPNDDSTPPVAT